MRKVIAWLKWKPIERARWWLEFAFYTIGGVVLLLVSLVALPHAMDKENPAQFFVGAFTGFLCMLGILLISFVAEASRKKYRAYRKSKKEVAHAKDSV